MYGIVDNIVKDNLFDGNSSAEILAMCESYFGKAVKNSLGNYFPKAMANSNESCELASIIIESDSDKKRDTFMDDDFQVSLSKKAYKLFNDEAVAILRAKLSHVLGESGPANEEIRRRFDFLYNCCNPEAIQQYVCDSLSSWYYIKSMEAINDIFKDHTKKLYSKVKHDLPYFFKLVELAQEKGIDLETIQMYNGYNALDVCYVLRERFDSVIDIPIELKGKSSEAISVTSEEDWIRDSIELIKDQIRKNKESIMDLLRQNEQLTDKLTELSSSNKVKLKI